jgi:alkylation response protein AidB-like acyl-CoA dehydrogenase
MDWQDSAEQAAFREEVRQVIQQRLPERYRSEERGGGLFEGGWQSDRKSADPTARKAADDWAKALAEQGWIAPHWPKQYGGTGLTVMEQFIFNQEMAEVGAPAVGGMGVSMLGPTLIVHGTDEQKQEHLPKILSGEVAWAEGYSEPGSGSDLASLQTRATRDGDDFVINGQKIWTSGAQYADWLFTLVRTDPNAPKHRGISFLLLDPNTPGLTVRPLTDMGWNQPFNETFFEDVRVPAKNLVGEENRGWYVGMTLLDFERSGIGTSVLARKQLGKLVEYAHTPEGRARSRLAEFDTLRHEVAERHIEITVEENFSLRIVSMQSADMIPNYESSMVKMFGSESLQRLQRLGTKAFGLYANVWNPDSEYAPLRAVFTQGYVWSVPMTIAGGTSEIQRNIIATRGLGLPRG